MAPLGEYDKPDYPFRASFSWQEILLIFVGTGAVFVSAIIVVIKIVGR